MQISSRFTIATHMLIILALEGKKQKLTSDILAGSVGVNPVIIRKTLSQLKNAGLISVARGTGGADIIKNLEDISLFDIYCAVECLGKSGQLFSFHDKPNPECPIGKNIHNVLDNRLEAIQKAMEAELAQTSLAEVVAATEKEMAKDSIS
ncbi:RRF2 family protein [Streptococcus cristatus]|uniref:Rrf2 family transcriptional regulator n=2 Tax=Streptococcus cristatus TaxID=45634 RepID=A0A512AEB9_STRCR|nr:Rrf2 family transcriptional regulator [Streptococcus cristatus]AGK71240.1 RRF2 family protein [Streptococcus cristatus AS 1.3089]GEN98037.1 Rrf2 family transcriptional regulator [Streptococcus cristatus]SQI46260.1 RRF2 family protein [Streptococcus cristatus]